MKRWWLVVGMSLVAAGAWAADAEELVDRWVITTDMYEVHFKTTAQAGYVRAIPAGGNETVIDMQGSSRSFYHSANYAGWVDWGRTVEAEVVEKGGGKLVMRFTQDDGNAKFYHVTATYWDGVPYFKHEVVVEAKSAVRSFSDGHEPMVEVRNGFGADNKFQMWETPIAHVAVENPAGFFALYTEMGTARVHDAWQPDGRMDLVHDNLGVQLDAGDMSDPLVYYIAVGAGGLDEADELADVVTQEPSGLAVSARGKLATVWGSFKRE